MVLQHRNDIFSHTRKFGGKTFYISLHNPMGLLYCTEEKAKEIAAAARNRGGQARVRAKAESVKLARKKKEYPKDQWATIDKFSRATGNSRPVESWMYHPATKTFSKERYVGSRWV